MAELEERVAVLETAVADLTQRLAATEETPAPARPEVGPGEIDFVLMERLQKRSGEGFEADGLKGSVIYAGSAQTGNGTAAWHVERPVPYLLKQSAELYAPLLGLLGHPLRLELVMTLLREGPLGSVALQEKLDGSSTGQFYHHLKELLGLQLVEQPLRGYYQVASKRVVPLLIILAAVFDLRGEGLAEDEAEET